MGEHLGTCHQGLAPHPPWGQQDGSSWKQKEEARRTLLWSLEGGRPCPTGFVVPSLRTGREHISGFKAPGVWCFVSVAPGHSCPLPSWRPLPLPVLPGPCSGLPCLLPSLAKASCEVYMGTGYPGPRSSGVSSALGAPDTGFLYINSAWVHLLEKQSPNTAAGGLMFRGPSWAGACD